MRALIRKAFFPVALLLGMGYPFYIAYDVATAGNLAGHCSRSGRGGVGLFCEWGPTLGETLFGPERAHLGYALLVGTSALLMLAFLALTLRGSASDPSD